MRITLENRDGTCRREIKNPFGDINPDDLPMLVIGTAVYVKAEVGYGGGCFVTFRKAAVKRLSEKAAKPLTKKQSSALDYVPPPVKLEPLTLAQFRRQMSKHGMSRMAGGGSEEWVGRSKSGRWSATITGNGQCRVRFSGGSLSETKEDLTYAEAASKIDLHGIYFAD